MPTISLLNPKGGAGKTTAATCIARALEAGGDRVLLVDADPQASTRDWSGLLEDNPTTVVGLDRAGGMRSLPGLQAGYDWTVIDGAGRYEKITAEVIAVSDLVLIPVQPSPFDIWPLEDLLSTIRQRQAITGGAPVAGALITRATPGSVLDREILDALAELELEALDSRLHQRQAFPRAANAGVTPLEYEPHGKAAAEVRAAVGEIRGVFNGAQ
jgi:chromosome partitioning protein